MTQEYKLPELGEGVKEGDVVKVLINPGDILRAEQTVLEIETNKAVVEVPAPAAGTVREVFIKAGTKAKIGQVLYTYDEAADSGAVSKTVQKPNVAASAAAAIPAAPAARREARDIGVDVAAVQGTGPGGRVLVGDIRAHAHARASHSGSSQSPVTKTSTPLPDFSKWGETERKAMTNVRRITAERLSESWQTIPHVTQFDRADVTVLEKLRSKFAKRAEEAGGKLTVTVILMKIVASALKVFPQFNASIDMSSNEIVYKKYFNIAIAVDTDRGLIVPVIKNVDKRNIIELSQDLAQAGVRARAHKTSLDEMQGASITITNLGGIGGTYFTPIINPPEVAILGVSRTLTEPAYSNGTWEPRQMLPLSLSYDHRIIDGADGARFLRWIAEAIKDPFLMELEG
jgi:pyruvate dehydrogenase E2 component (dihydrolipoamide acetyltransferase)